MEMTISLCMNCENAPGCTLRNGHPVVMCEEHNVAKVLSPKKTLDWNTLSQKATTLSHFQGLCSNCDVKESCLWHEPETITFSCEHYQ